MTTTTTTTTSSLNKEHEDDLYVMLARTLCQSIQQWIDDADASTTPALFCDKQKINTELQAKLQQASSTKSERKRLTKEYKMLMKDKEGEMRELCVDELPLLHDRFLKLFQDLQPTLQAFEQACQQRREQLITRIPPQKKKSCCRIFYDGTPDDAYSNFKPFPFSLGKLGFLKGEQFFHVCKALVCQDFKSATNMMVTTSGPQLRKMGRMVENYDTLGASWENLDSGMLLLVCLIIKVAQLHLPAAACVVTTTNSALAAEVANDATDSSLLYIAEGALDDSRCGIGIHAMDPTIFDHIPKWGRNQLGHACMAVVAGFHVSNEDGATTTTKKVVRFRNA